MNRGLTRQQAEDGVIPEPLTQAEWQALHDAALIAEGEALQRTFDARVKAEVRADERQQAVESRPLTAADHIAALQSMGATKLTDECGNFTNGYVQVVWVCQSMYTVLILPPEMTP